MRRALRGLLKRPCPLALLSLLLASCTSAPKLGTGDGISRALPPPANIAEIPEPIPREEPLSDFGNPESYVVFGRRYYTLKDGRSYRERGIASWYGSKFHGQRTSSGETYDMYAVTAAHKTLPLPSYARVTNLRNKRSIIVRINDRGPFHDIRLIDLSYTAAWKLGIVGEGTGLVEVAFIEPGAPPPAIEAQKVAPPLIKGLPELFLQVGAFGSINNADRLKQRLEEQLKVKVLIEETTDNAPPLFRVQVGPIASVELADYLTRQLDRLGITDPHVVIR
jgi:rare lipoprotein A